MTDFREDIWRRYLLVSNLLLACAIGHVSMQSTGFYEMTIYFMNNKTCMAILYNYVFMLFTFICRIPVFVFMGRLSTLETEQLQEMTRNYVMDAVIFLVLSKPRLNGRELPIGVLVKYLTLLVALKCFHILIYVRLSNMFQMDIPSFSSIIRLCCFIYLMAMIDCRLLTTFWDDLNWKNTFTIWLVFEVIGMLLLCIFSTLRYIVNLLDYYYEEGLNNKTTVNFYLELLHDLLSLACFTVFMLIFYVHNPHNMPAYMLIDILHVVKNLTDRVNMLVHYRHMVTVIESRFPKPTHEEKDADGSCIICREAFDEDTRKLECGHIFHMSCLKSWLFQHSTCPTCRAPIQENLTTQTELFDLSRIFLNMERRVRRLTRRMRKAVRKAINGSDGSDGKDCDPNDVQKLVDDCSCYIMAPIFEQLNGKRLVFECPAKKKMYKGEVAEGEKGTNVVQTDGNTGVILPKTASETTENTIIGQGLKFNTVDQNVECDESHSGDQKTEYSSTAEVTRIDNPCEGQADNIPVIEDHESDKNFDGTQTEVVNEVRPRRRFRDILGSLRSEGLPDSSDDADKGESTDVLISNEPKTNEAKESATDVKEALVELSPPKDESASKAIVNNGQNEDSTTNVTHKQAEVNDDEDNVESTKTENDSSFSRLMLPEWLSRSTNNRIDPDKKVKAGLLTLLKKLKKLKERLTVLAKAEEEKRALLEAEAKAAVAAAVTLSGRLNTENEVLHKEVEKQQLESSSSQTIRQIRISKLSGKPVEQKCAASEKKAISDQSCEKASVSQDDSKSVCIPEQILNGPPESRDTAAQDFVNTNEATLVSADVLPKVDMTMPTVSQAINEESTLVSPAETEPDRTPKVDVQSGLETTGNQDTTPSKEDEVANLINVDDVNVAEISQNNNDSISTLDVEKSQSPPQNGTNIDIPLIDASVSNVKDTDFKDANESDEGRTPVTLGPHVVIPRESGTHPSTPSASATSTDDTAEAINNLLNELKDFEQMHNCDVLLESDDTTDEMFLSQLDSENMHEYQRDLFITYGKMMRMWLLTAEGLSRSDERLREVFTTVNRHRLSSAANEKQRNLFRNILSNINCQSISKKRLETLHQDCSIRSFTYKDGLWQLSRSVVAVDIMEHMLTTLALMDNIVKSEFQLLQKA